ncbi:Integrating conjugative element protein, family [Pseudomonas savastanoi pv. glycinea]|uniref:TIGR03758 family integrating conjugative element protein n=1 Tax=Pseudomonas quasicaspiana TaxID=2829821 RepID=UPI000EFF7D4E|nr:TIGR03758 family integrating conjugative element protein [Pseudomonas quasicaspiana]MCD5976771.1 TIGR03758 family integrating conjugative element protein [Pseudomonas quasicaspiana]RMQ98655.1 Integrating conjugative element protein, family [Pseudomonas savastanoi pv. glycinea]
MSMTPEQANAFQAGGGFTAQDTMTLFVGFALTLILVFSAWALGSGYRGWSKGKLSNEQFGTLALKITMLYLLLGYLLLH